MARRLGYTEKELAALDHAQEDETFDPSVRVALLYAERMTRDAHQVTDDLFDRLREHYSERQILELTCVIALSNYFNRFSTALRIDLSGSDAPYESGAGA